MQPPSIPQDQALPAKPKILVAEDDDDIRSVFEMVLGESYDIRSASTASHALSLAAAWTPDVVLLDWTLPDASGEEVVRRLRAMKAEHKDPSTSAGLKKRRESEAMEIARTELAAYRREQDRTAAST